MNINNLTIEFDSAEGSIRRLLGVIEARGFQVRTMTMGSDLERANITVGITPRDEGRCVNVLSRQIARVSGVHHVASFPPAMVGPSMGSPAMSSSSLAREVAHGTC